MDEDGVDGYYDEYVLRDEQDLPLWTAESRDIAENAKKPKGAMYPCTYAEPTNIFEEGELEVVSLEIIVREVQ